MFNGAVDSDGRTFGVDDGPLEFEIDKVSIKLRRHSPSFPTWYTILVNTEA
jgi:hypothetical protein